MSLDAPARQSHRGAVALLLFGLLMGGCSPLVPLLGAVLGGGVDKPRMAAGPFAGAPSATQNSRPSDSVVNDALAGVDDRIRPVCQAQLPSPEPDPVVGCVLRPTCLPGSDRPISLRMCAGASRAALSDPIDPVDSDWRWSGDLAERRP